MICSSAGPSWAWNAGPDGRLVLDPLCESASKLLCDGGSLLLVQSAFAGVQQSLDSLRVDRAWTRSRCLPMDSIRSGAVGAGGLAGGNRPAAARMPGRGAGCDSGGQAMTCHPGTGGTQRPRAGIRSGTHRDARRRCRRVRPIHGGHLHLWAQQEISAVRHQPPEVPAPKSRAEANPAVSATTSDPASRTP